MTFRVLEAPAPQLGNQICRTRSRCCLRPGMSSRPSRGIYHALFPSECGSQLVTEKTGKERSHTSPLLFIQSFVHMFIFATWWSARSMKEAFANLELQCSDKVMACWTIQHLPFRWPTSMPQWLYNNRRDQWLLMTHWALDDLESLRSTSLRAYSWRSGNQRVRSFCFVSEWTAFASLDLYQNKIYPCSSTLVQRYNHRRALLRG